MHNKNYICRYIIRIKKLTGDNLSLSSIENFNLMCKERLAICFVGSRRRQGKIGISFSWELMVIGKDSYLSRSSNYSLAFLFWPDPS